MTIEIPHIEHRGNRRVLVNKTVAARAVPQRRTVCALQTFRFGQQSS
ncbi:hypothetical protein [Burkholderia sp. 22PA0106]